MRTNIDIDDALMASAMSVGPYKTKKDAVEAGLKLLARQAAYREILKWRGKLKWEGDESVDWTTAPAAPASAPRAAEPGIGYAAVPAESGALRSRRRASAAPAAKKQAARRAGR